MDGEEAVGDGAFFSSTAITEQIRNFAREMEEESAN